MIFVRKITHYTVSWMMIKWQISVGHSPRKSRLTYTKWCYHTNCPRRLASTLNINIGVSDHHNQIQATTEMYASKSENK